MEHLKRNSIVVYLKLEFDEIKKDCLPAEGLQETVTRALRMFTKSGCFV